MAVGSTQPWGVKGGRRVRMTISSSSLSRLPRKCGSLDVSQTYGLPRPVTGIALLSNLLHRVESFLRSRQSFSHSRNSQYFMESHGSLSCSQDPAIGPCPQPDESNPCHSVLFL
jgi:hypothetical protein